MSRRKKSNTEELLEELAEAILLDALKDETPLALRMEAFKVCVPYYSVNLKAKKAPEDEDADNFTNFRATIDVATKKET